MHLLLLGREAQQCVISAGPLALLSNGFAKQILLVRAGGPNGLRESFAHGILVTVSRRRCAAPTLPDAASEACCS